MKHFYKIPFKVGKWYKTKCTVFGLFEKLPEGLELKYKSTGNSTYDSMIGFFFEDKEGNDRRWDIHDRLDPIEESKSKFEES